MQLRWGLGICVLAAVTFAIGWNAPVRTVRAWQATLPLPVSLDVAEQWTTRVVGASGTVVVPIPATELRYPEARVLSAARRVHRKQHVHLWALPMRLSGGLPSLPYQPPPATAQVWVVGIEGYCNEIGISRLGPQPPTAVCWAADVFLGDTGREWYSVSVGEGPGNPPGAAPASRTTLG